MKSFWIMFLTQLYLISRKKMCFFLNIWFEFISSLVSIWLLKVYACIYMLSRKFISSLIILEHSKTLSKNLQNFNIFWNIRCILEHCTMLSNFLNNSNILKRPTILWNILKRILKIIAFWHILKPFHNSLSIHK